MAHTHSTRSGERDRDGGSGVLFAAVLAALLLVFAGLVWSLISGANLGEQQASGADIAASLTQLAVSDRAP